jgi:hypothetical protein
MKHRRSLCAIATAGLILLSVTVGLLSVVPSYARARTADSILLSKLIWGMPSDRLARALKLDRSQYTVLHDPTDTRITIFETDGTPFNFPEFRKVYLNFDPTDGLFKVTGFYDGGLTEIVKVLKKRYGEPDLAKKTSLADHYRWDFEDTELSIINTLFEIRPK